MSAALAAPGNDVTLVVRRIPSRELPIEGSPFDFYGVPSSFALEKLDPWPILATKTTFAVQAAGWARRRGADLVFSRSLAASAVSAQLGIPVIYESHTPERKGNSRRLYQWLLRSPRLRTHVVITEALKAHYVEERGVPGSRIFVAPDGADPVRVATAGSKDAGRADVGRTDVVLGHADSADVGHALETPEPRDRHLRIGYVGHLYEGRGIDLILELARRLPEAEFHLVGGTEEDVARWLPEAESAGNVRLHGFLPPARLDAYRQSFDILLAPYARSVAVAGGGGLDTVKWMSPLKLFEYMAAGKAIVVSDLPAIEEVVEDGVNVVLAAPGDPDDWEAKLRALTQDPTRRERLGESALELFLNKYTWEKRAERILEAAYRSG
ncbi:MAG: glycosyltransferase family 4 protein [Candidatus Eisenbacteria bacterium]|uniref:Glycosyltransferase family 4 protein n=1 Tax=Eiseniibacteriota bacterium TaxID=2212470 RepID=A0A956SF53_UNCEI|nr:glycosyltransferase family 4 protein [Candidatus Eisenbacteria bacterium]